MKNDLRIKDNNGNYVILIALGDEERVPKAVTDYFDQFEKESDGLVRLSHSAYRERLEGGTKFIYTLVLTITEPCSMVQFEEYMDALVYDTFLRELLEVNVEIIDIHYNNQIIRKFSGLGASGGEYSVILKLGKFRPFVEQLLKEVFGLDGEALLEAEEVIDDIGMLKIENCISRSGLMALDYIMNKTNLKYELSENV